MTGGYIDEKIKKTNKKLIIIGFIGLVIVLGALFFSLDYYIQFFNGPYQITGKDLGQFMDSGNISKRYVTVNVDQIFDSGVYAISTNKDGTAMIEDRRYIVTVDDLQFVYSSASYNGEKTLTGQLYWLSNGYDDQFEKIARNSASSSANLVFVPFALIDENYTYRGYVGLVTAGLMALLSVLILVNGIRGVLHPELSHSLTELYKLGPIDFTISRIESEMQASHQTLGKTHLLASWLVIENASGFTAVRYEDIVWVYKQSVTNKNFGIKFPNVEALVINDCFERSIYLPLKNGQLDTAMNLLMPHIPFAYKGFSEELANVWRQNPQALIREVEGRKYAIATQTPMLNTSQRENTASQHGDQD
jgi:hypothetical protein